MGGVIGEVETWNSVTNMVGIMGGMGGRREYSIPDAYFNFSCLHSVDNPKLLINSFGL